MKIYRIAQAMPLEVDNVDKNTLMVGNISSVAEAKRRCKDLPWSDDEVGGAPRGAGYGNSIPGPGKEAVVDQGTVNLKYTPTMSNNTPFTYEKDDEYGIPKQYKTYLQNNSGTFSVWTWISN